MAIRIKHDAPGVVPPSNQATRKYGQNLVLQQQQQKYQGQQAGYDRLFQLGRDNLQNTFQTQRDNRQNEFQISRDKTQFEQQQQAAEAARQQSFLDEARKQSGRFILDAIENDEFDPVTARQLRQNLVAEAEALGNPQLDATQRAEVLQKIRARRSILLSNRKEKEPEPTPQEQFDRSIVVDPQTGMRFRVTPDGKYEPLPEPEAPPPAPPASAQEYYAANEEQFQKDLNAKMQAMQDAADLDPENAQEVTPQAAWEEMQKDYDFRQKALGRRGQPTAAPELPGDTPAAPRTEQSILETDASAPVPSAPTAEQIDAEMTAQGYQLRTPPSGNPYYLRDDRPAVQDAPSQGQPAAEPPQNAWSEVAAEDTPKRGRLPVTANAQSQNPQAPMAANAAGGPTRSDIKPPAVPSTPDFGKLVASAANDSERAVVSKIETLYKGQSPDVQSAISVALDPNSSETDVGQALMYLRDKGIDINSLAAEAEQSSKPGEKAKGRMREKYGSSYDSF